MSTSGYDGSEEIPMEPSGSGEKDDQGRVIMLERDIFGSGWDNVEQITRFVTSDVRAQAARSGEPDKFLQMMEGIVGNMVHSLELGSSPLCCSLVLYCAEEFERTQRPRLALHLYEMALGLSKQDCRMVDLTKSAKRGYEELVAAGIQREIDAGFPTWDTLPEKFIRGPYYRSVCDPAGEHVGYQICWEFEMKEGRENIPEINFSYCDYMRILHKGDRLKCLHGIMDQFTNYMEETPCMRGTPLHCSFLFLCAHEFKRMRKLEDAIKLFSKAQEFASQDPEMRILEKRACHTLAMMFSRDLHKERSAEPYFRRFVELVDEVADLDDFVELHNIGVGLIEAGRWEDAVTAHTKCLMMMSVAPSRFIMDASLLLMLLSRSYEQLDEHHAALLLVEQARLRAEMESCQCNKPCTECGLSETHDHKKTCVMHSILPRILAHQGRLQSRYRSWAEASETLEKGLELAKQADDHELISNLEHHLFEDILVAHNNLNLHMSGNFTLSAADLFTKTESFFHRLQLLKVPENDPFSEQRKDYRNRIKFWLDLRKEGASDRDLQALELNTIELARAKERGDGPWFLCISHLAVLDDLQFMHRSSDLEDIRYHFKEAVKCAASFADRTDMDAVNMRLSLGFHALTPRIQDLDEAVRIFTGVIQVVEKKLEQLATMSDDHALRFFEMTKHAYMYMTYTYIIYATRSQFVVNEAGYEVLANSSANSSSPQRMQVPDDPEMLRRALLWSERSKGRLLMKRLEQPLISINLDCANVQPSDDVDQAVSDSAITNWEMTSLDREFHTDDDWAVDFIFRGNKFPHHGSKMVFVEFTMVSKNELATFIMNDHTGTIQGFRRSNLCLAIDETARKIAEEEMELLIRELHIYQKLDERAASTSKFPPALYAMNEPESRMLYFNPWIPGLVARFQRLTIEIQTLRESRQVRSPDGTTINDKMKQIDYLLTTLYKILIGPLEEAFRLLFEQCPDYTLVFVPHEDLSVLPFPALLDENRKYLIEKYPVAVAPSIWVARHCQHLYDRQLQMTPSPTPGSELLIGRKTGYPENWKDLSKAHEEIACIKEFCAGSVDVVIDSEGNEGPARRPMKERMLEHVQTASWVHFAVHGQISRAFPRGSLLLGDNDMARWNSDEISAAGLPCARSVVLSACQSGLGTLGGEGVLGFARAFVRAGVPSCVLSMWEVDEGFCLGFMKQLYSHLHSGEDLAHAMHKSTVYMMQERIPPRFKFEKLPPLKWSVLDWAAFSCIGYAGVRFPSQSRTEI